MWVCVIITQSAALRLIWIILSLIFPTLIIKSQRSSRKRRWATFIKSSTCVFSKHQKTPIPLSSTQSIAKGIKTSCLSETTAWQFQAWNSKQKYIFCMAYIPHAHGAQRGQKSPIECELQWVSYKMSHAVTIRIFSVLRIW